MPFQERRSRSLVEDRESSVVNTANTLAKGEVLRQAMLPNTAPPNGKRIAVGTYQFQDDAAH